jgi:CheY-like chemotaxis protein
MGYQVLLIDDDEATRMVYREILTRVNFEVIEASDGVSGVDMLSQHSPDVVILDLLLPRKPGTEVLDFIYSTPHLADTRVIIFSAHERMLGRTLRDGDEFLLKPLSPKLIREAVQRAVSSSPLAH